MRKRQRAGRRGIVRIAVVAAIGGLAAFIGGGAAMAARYDTIIRNGTIVDGSGMAPFVGDVAIVGGHVAAVGKLGRAEAATVVDARGMVVAPGFINIHSHAQPAAVATAVNMLTQGVTTEITNADGQGTTDIAGQLAKFGESGLAENVGLYIGFNAAWQATVGDRDRRATPAEIATMQGILDRNLASGAWGVAAGLDYKPGYFADEDEVIAILAVAKRWRTNFPNHERLRPEQSYSSFKGMAETVEIGERAGVMPVITHIKTQGAEQGNAPAVIDLMDRATARGTYTPADVYPYIAGSSGLTLLVPGWAHEGGRPAMLKRFADPATRAKIIVEAEEAMALRFGGAPGVRVLKTGQVLTDAMKQWRVGAGEALVRLIEQEEYGAILTFGREDDVVAFLKYPNSAIACDCGANLGTRIHPRNWGSFPRVLGHYVRETQALTLPDAIRKMTALPAATIGMSDRGYLAPGMAADVVVFDPKTIRDNATYDEPTLPSAGVRDVFVNGRAALRDGAATGVKSGVAALRDAHMPSRPMTPPQARRSMAGRGRLSDGAAARYAVTFALAQRPGGRAATGAIRLVDERSGAAWTADGIGTIQVARGWSSVTAMLRGPGGRLQPATLTLEQAGGTDPSAPARIALALAGTPQPLSGPYETPDR